MGGLTQFAHLGPVTTAPEQREAARAFVARHALDDNEKARLLAALGLEAS